MRLQGTVLLVGKTATSLATGGVELLGATGQIYSTADTNVPSIVVNRQGTADVDGGVFTSFRHNNTQVGSIQSTTPAPPTSSTSRRRTTDSRTTWGPSSTASSGSVCSTRGESPAKTRRHPSNTTR